jgi:hypothetical protein
MAGTRRLSSDQSALSPACWTWEIGVKRAVDTYHETISTKASSQEHVMTDQQQRLSIRFPVLVNLVLPLIPVAQIGLRIIQVFDVIGFRERTASTFA